jgi:hypothetical protein
MNNTFQKNSTNEDGYEFFIRNLADYLPYVILNTLGAVFGLIGSILVIGSIACTKELRNMTNMIIANLAFADFILSSTSDTFAIAGLDYKKILILF